jgi:outer membrane usher protein
MPNYLANVLMGMTVFGLFLSSTARSLAQSKPVPQEQALYLEVYINGQPSGLIANFTLRPRQRLAITVSELRELRITPCTSSPSEGLIELDGCPGLSYRYDQITQVVRIEVVDRHRIPYQLDSRTLADAEPEIQSTPGAVLNYTLFGASNTEPRDFYLAYQKQANFSAGFEARAFGAYGVLSQSALLTTGTDVVPESVRLDTTWSYSDQRSLTTYRAGDVISGGLNWTRSFRLGGVQMQRNFSLRPDLVTLPLPRFSSSAALPSTVDVFVNSVKTYTGNVPAGPFQIQNLPVMSGAGNQRIVVQDALGRETVIEQPFYTSAKMLGTGLLDFSMESGFIRRDYGVTSDVYDNMPVASGSLRYGLHDRVTLEAHGEGGDSLFNVGIGVNVLLASWGVASLAVAGSQANQSQILADPRAKATGGLVSASLELGHSRYSLYVHTQRTTIDYLDLASLPSTTGLFSNLSPIANKPARAIDQIAFNVPLSFDVSSLNISMTRMRDALDNRYDILGLSYSRPVTSTSSLFVTAFKDFANSRSYGLFGGLTMTFGGNVTATGVASKTAAETTGGIDLVKAQSNEPGSWGWRLRDYEGSSPTRAGALSYRSSFGRAEVGAEQINGTLHTTGQFDGAVAMVGGGVFLANRMDDAFAVIDAGAPNVDVFFENRPLATTGTNGLALVPNLRPYQKNWISIDPKNLAVDADVPMTKAAVVPPDRGAALIKFGISSQAHGAVVVLKTADGKAVRAGAHARLQTSARAQPAEQPQSDNRTGHDTGNNMGEAVVGYGGEVYVRGLQDHNKLYVERADGPPCEAGFDYHPGHDSQVVIRDVVCR